MTITLTSTTLRDRTDRLVLADALADMGRDVEARALRAERTAVVVIRGRVFPLFCLVTGRCHVPYVLISPGERGTWIAAFHEVFGVDNEIHTTWNSGAKIVDLLALLWETSERRGDGVFIMTEAECRLLEGYGVRFEE